MQGVFNLFFVFVCVSGQSVHLGMGGSWSRAIPRHLWTLCHILSGLLYLLLHCRVSKKTSDPFVPSLHKHMVSYYYPQHCVQELDRSVYSCSLTLTCVFQGLCGHSALWKDQLRETPGKVRALLLATHTNWYTEGKSTLKHTHTIWPHLHKQMNWLLMTFVNEVCLAVTMQIIKVFTVTFRHWMRWSWRWSL